MVPFKAMIGSGDTGGGVGGFSATYDAGDLSSTDDPTFGSATRTCTPTGGATPYSYRWRVVGGTGDSWVVLFSGGFTTDSTGFEILSQASGTTKTYIVRCEVTDNNGNKVWPFPDITLTYTRSS